MYTISYFLINITVEMCNTATLKDPMLLTITKPETNTAVGQLQVKTKYPSPFNLIEKSQVEPSL